MSYQFKHFPQGSTIGSGSIKFKHYGEEVPAIQGYLTFESPNAFTITIPTTATNDGTIQYSTDTTTWNNVTKGTAISSVNNKLYFRGSNNTYCRGNYYAGFFAMSGSSISCNGNIETMLDYETVLAGEHPTMAEFSCYDSMFVGCTSLITAPALPATTLAESCYQFMFGSCTSLTAAPALPATTLATYCYSHMFDNCTSLVAVPTLPATTLATYCYFGMFEYCTNIKLSTIQTGIYQTAYRIPITGAGTTAQSALMGMFRNTGGTFTGTPTINTTYYTSNTIIGE